MKCLAIILFVACAAVVSAQIPFRCVSPPTWEARVYSYESASSFRRIGRFYYDAPGERTSFFEEIYEGDEETASYYEYFFHKQRYSLRYNTFTKECSRRNITYPFRTIGVPPTAKFVDAFVIGTNAIEELGLAVNVWADNAGTNGRTIMEFVADDGDGDEDCFPISFTEFGGGPGSMGFRHQDFYNIVAGVDPDQFIPPRECQ